MSIITNQINSAIVSGSTYQPVNTDGSLLSNVGNSTLLNSSADALNASVINAAFTPTFTAEQATALSSLDSLTMSSILNSTDYNASTSLFSSLSGTNLYSQTESMLANQFLTSDLDIEI